MAKKSKEIKEKLAEVNPLTISECCEVNYISSGSKVYCSKCKADCRLERQKKLIKLWSPKA
jgi:uncharacterized paraquat-inducible protein A